MYYMNEVRLCAGIGNRDAPEAVLSLTVYLARIMSQCGWFFRTGAAAGMDSAFMSATDSTELFTPWPGFNGYPFHVPIPDKAYEIASMHSPTWQYMKPAVRALHARNVMIILGADLQAPVEMVLCYTRDGCESVSTRSRHTGGTGSAISLASSMGIPVINLFNDNALFRLSMMTGLELNNC